MRAMLMVVMFVAGCGDTASRTEPDAAVDTTPFWACRMRRACAGQPEINIGWINESASTELDAERKLVDSCEATACPGALACSAHCCLRGDPCE